MKELRSAMAYHSKNKADAAGELRLENAEKRIDAAKAAMHAWRASNMDVDDPTSEEEGVYPMDYDDDDDTL